MTLQEIKTAVEQGKTVYWSATNYLVIKDSLGQFFIKCLNNNNCIGLTWADGTTMNGDPKDFLIEE